MEQLTRTDKEVIVFNGPPQIPLSFPRDSFGHHFPENTFHETLPNGEKVSQDWCGATAVGKSAKYQAICVHSCLHCLDLKIHNK